MKTKIIAFLVAFAAAFTAQAYNTETVDGIEWTYSVYDGEATVRGIPKSTSGAITVPSVLGGCSVTDIGGDAFSDCTSLVSITIPDTVTDLDIDGFSGCTSLKILKLPRKLDQDCCDDFYRFRYLPSLTEVNIPEGVKKIDLE